jgi:hypothetical protein
MSALNLAVSVLEAEVRNPDEVRRQLAAMRPVDRARIANLAWRLGVLAEPRQHAMLRRGPVIEHQREARR